MSGVRDAYQLWINEYQQAWLDPAALAERSCPNSGCRSLQLVFVVDEAGDQSGLAVFWCEACRQGLIPTRAPLPYGCRVLLRGAAAIPDYRVVAGE